MGKLATTYQYIADILSYKSSKDDLEKTLGNKDFDWDTMVVEGSRHLVLPTIYCRLTSKDLLHLLPEELNTYLEEITSLNENRNAQLLIQINHLSELLKAHEIEHVFLKGAALICGGYYNDLAERMIGDIDILISNHQLDMAFELLKENSYYPMEQTLGNDFFEHRHLSRLKSDAFIGVVELHRILLPSDKDKELSSPNILASKQIINGIFIPSTIHLMRHTILNYQINDNGSLYNSINFRSAYDSIVLLENIKDPSLIGKGKKITTYLNILALFFEDIPKAYASSNFTTRFYRFKLKHLSFYKFWVKTLKVYIFLKTVLKRVPHFFVNKAYRMALFKDRKRVFKLFKSFFYNRKE
ncbi:nucleotidyltransferase family protein [Winogradskyella sp. HB-48]|uniref:nucleotidyltransferase family protein n=1 Tax=Winogradskyella sp. HB-48 TaxID=3416808 RepID=UPI003CEB276E